MRLLLLLLKKGTLHEAIGFLMSPPLPKKITQGNEEMKMIEQQILYSVRVREQRACVVPRMRAQYTYKV